MLRNFGWLTNAGFSVETHEKTSGWDVGLIPSIQNIPGEGKTSVSGWSNR